MVEQGGEGGRKAPAEAGRAALPPDRPTHPRLAGSARPPPAGTRHRSHPRRSSPRRLTASDASCTTSTQAAGKPASTRDLVRSCDVSEEIAADSGAADYTRHVAPGWANGPPVRVRTLVCGYAIMWNAAGTASSPRARQPLHFVTVRRYCVAGVWGWRGVRGGVGAGGGRDGVRTGQAGRTGSGEGQVSLWQVGHSAGWSGSVTRHGPGVHFWNRYSAPAFCNAARAPTSQSGSPAVIRRVSECHHSIAWINVSIMSGAAAIKWALAFISP